MRKMQKKTKVKNIIIKNAADVFTPLSIVFGSYVILHGHLSPGGGFQGGVLAAAAIILLYLGYGYKELKNTFNFEMIRKQEAVGAIAYTVFGLLGIFYGYNFCRNVLFKVGNPGDLMSSGTIFFMNFSVGYKVLAGVSFLIFLLVKLLSDDNDQDH